MVTLGKKGTIAPSPSWPSPVCIRKKPPRSCSKDIAPAFKDRRSGYTRIIKLGQRPGDALQSAILEWVEDVVPAAPAAAAAEAKPEERSKPLETQSPLD
jgi:large subunit ribosomal protein L17